MQSLRPASRDAPLGCGRGYADSWNLLMLWIGVRIRRLHAVVDKSEQGKMVEVRRSVVESEIASGKMES